MTLSNLDAGDGVAESSRSRSRNGNGSEHVTSVTPADRGNSRGTQASRQVSNRARRLYSQGARLSSGAKTFKIYAQMSTYRYVVRKTVSRRRRPRHVPGETVIRTQWSELAELAPLVSFTPLRQDSLKTISLAPEHLKRGSLSLSPSLSLSLYTT